VLTSGGGYIRLKGGNIEIHCPGPASFKASNFDLSGPASQEAEKKSFGEPLGSSGPNEPGSGGGRL